MGRKRWLLVPVALLVLSTPAQAEPNRDVNGSRLVLVGDLVTQSGSLANVNAVRNLTAALNPAAVMHLGDLQYECGTPALYQSRYGAVYGGMKPKIRPAIGNHEYCNGSDPNATGYRGYFGSQAFQDNGAPYYSFHVNLPGGGQWLVVVLDSNCQQWAPAPRCDLNSAMANYLRQVLNSDTTSRCELVIFHEPAFASGDAKPEMRDIWWISEVRGVDLIVSGHVHGYEYFYPQTHTGVRDFTNGIRSVIVGTGGRSLNPFGAVHPNSFRRYNDQFGVMQLDLRRDGWSSYFKTINGQTRDPHSVGCRV
jgi:Calcineurin-like phosphoesterase